MRMNVISRNYDLQGTFEKKKKVNWVFIYRGDDV